MTKHNSQSVAKSPNQHHPRPQGFKKIHRSLANIHSFLLPIRHVKRLQKCRKEEDQRGGSSWNRWSIRRDNASPRWQDYPAQLGVIYGGILEREWCPTCPREWPGRAKTRPDVPENTSCELRGWGEPISIWAKNAGQHSTRFGDRVDSSLLRFSGSKWSLQFFFMRKGSLIFGLV